MTVSGVGMSITKQQAGIIRPRDHRAAELDDAAVKAHLEYLNCRQYADVIEAMTEPELTAYTFQLLDNRLAFQNAVNAQNAHYGRAIHLPDWEHYEARYRMTTIEAHEHDLVWAATVRDVFDLQLTEMRSADATHRDQAIDLLEKAACLAEITQCAVCHGPATDDQERSCCHEVIGSCCTDEHDLLCPKYFAELREEYR
jgi:hypothetical protein